MTARLELSDVSVIYPGQPAPTVEGCSFRVAGGEILGVLGQNGSGKTTLAEAICGIIPHLIRGRVGGQIQINGHDLAGLSTNRRFALVGYTFQDTESQILFGTVRDVLDSRNGRGSDSFFDRALDILGVRHLLDRLPDELSGGEAQRVVLLGALRMNPPVLVYDEATSALDPQARRDFGFFTELLRAEGMATLLLGQRPQVLSRWCGRVIGLPRGRHIEAEDADVKVATDVATAFWNKLPQAAARPAEMSALALSGVQVRGVDRLKPRLTRVDFQVSPGERVALLGPNGAGKTTLLLAILGAIRANEGIFQWSGRQFTPRQWRRLRPPISFVTQSPYYRIIGSTIEEEFEIAMGLHTRVHDAVWWPLVHDCFPYLIPDIDPFQLSYGQQRWLTTLTALLGSQPIILLDEPEQGLDEATLDYLTAWLEIYSGRRGKSVVFSTHDLEFAASFADRCVLLREGKVLAETSLHDADALESWYFQQVNHVQ